ncbi:MAG: pyridoxal 5'-phosphate synthase glutaminase subunit PdxT [Acidimicrobiales bacterium]
MGVLALQGDVREHVAALAEVGVASRPVKRPADLPGLAGCVLPGGESTTLSMLLTSTGLWDPLGDLIGRGFPVFGTCAGLVLLATEVLDGRDDQRTFGALDVVVRRNGFGRQLQSFEAELEVGEELGGGPAGVPLPAVFIRAPLVVRAGSGVEVLARVARGGAGGAGGAGGPVDGAVEGAVDGSSDGSSPALIRQGHVLASAFHPELTPDRRLHRCFARMCGW